jgi:hypothetical protein
VSAFACLAGFRVKSKLKTFFRNESHGSEVESALKLKKSLEAALPKLGFPKGKQHACFSWFSGYHP